MRKISFLIILLLVICGLIPSAKISAFSVSTSDSRIEESIFPSTFDPGDTATINLKSYYLNLDSCQIGWTENGEDKTTAIGNKSFSFTSPTLGQTTKIKATVICDNNIATLVFAFQGNNLNFLISADTYTPPFYRGAKLASINSTIKVVSVPEVFDDSGNLISSDTLVYRWSIGNQLLQEASGYNKNTLVIQGGDLPSLKTINLKIYSLGGELKAEKNVTISVNKPKIFIYEKKPLLGELAQSVWSGDKTITGDEVTLAAEPYFFSATSLKNSRIKFSWQMNNKELDNKDNSLAMVFRVDQNTTGQANINFSATDQDNILNVVKTSLNLFFGQK